MIKIKPLHLTKSVFPHLRGIWSGKDYQQVGQIEFIDNRFSHNQNEAIEKKPPVMLNEAAENPMLRWK